MYKLLGKGMTTDTQLTKVGKKLLGASYLGTFSSDIKISNIPKNLPIYFIINVDGEYDEGSHWLAISRLAGNDKYHIYDSFARKSKILIPTFIKSHYKYIDLNKNADQTTKETNCGARCMAVLVYVARHGIKSAKCI